ncbi:hypothetical protein, partial [Klebsiella pneumoniae]|uniref:hypothetical protein n=1 Tax=Klebsiella pneumoniae TaxID=573 RepID=UPI001D0DAFD8
STISSCFYPDFGVEQQGILGIEQSEGHKIATPNRGSLFDLSDSEKLNIRGEGLGFTVFQI